MADIAIRRYDPSSGFNDPMYLEDLGLDLFEHDRSVKAVYAMLQIGRLKEDFVEGEGKARKLNTKAFRFFKDPNYAPRDFNEYVNAVSFGHPEDVKETDENIRTSLEGVWPSVRFGDGKRATLHYVRRQDDGAFDHYSVTVVGGLSLKDAYLVFYDSERKARKASMEEGDELDDDEGVQVPFPYVDDYSIESYAKDNGLYRVERSYSSDDAVLNVEYVGDGGYKIVAVYEDEEKAEQVQQEAAQSSKLNRRRF
jgi:hypothetical protein